MVRCIPSRRRRRRCSMARRRRPQRASPSLRSSSSRRPRGLRPFTRPSPASSSSWRRVTRVRRSIKVLVFCCYFCVFTFNLFPTTKMSRVFVAPPHPSGPALISHRTPNHTLDKGHRSVDRRRLTRSERRSSYENFLVAVAVLLLSLGSWFFRIPAMNSCHSTPSVKYPASTLYTPSPSFRVRL